MRPSGEQAEIRLIGQVGPPVSHAATLGLRVPMPSLKMQADTRSNGATGVLA